MILKLLQFLLQTIISQYFINNPKKSLPIILQYFALIPQIYQLLQSEYRKKKMAKGQYQSLKEDVSKFCKCSVKTRLIGYVVCFVIGWLLSFGATIMFFVKHNIPGFAILFSLGQVINIAGSCFLATPKTQIKDMFKRARIWFTIAYLSSTVLTIVLACTLPEHLRYLILISLIVQVAAYFFYTLSFIPYGQKILGKICKVMVDSE